MNKLSDYEEAGFVGSVDISLDISLFEYGLIHRHREEDNDYCFVYGVRSKMIPVILSCGNVMKMEIGE